MAAIDCIFRALWLASVEILPSRGLQPTGWRCCFRQGRRPTTWIPLSLPYRVLLMRRAALHLAFIQGATPSGTAIASQTFSGISFTTTATALTENLSDGFAVAANSNYTLLLTNSVPFGKINLTTTGANLSGGASGLTYLGRKF